jgi:streptogramin lyase
LNLSNSLGTCVLLEGPAGGTASDMVVATGAWTATASDAWLHSSASGSGNGLAVFTFDANPGATRTGTLTIAGQTLTVTQAGSNYVAAQLAALVPAPVNQPSGVAVDSSGNIYIANTGDGTIKEYLARAHQVVTLVSSGLSAPQGVAVDGSGNVYIADTSNGAIKEYNAGAQQVSTLVSGLNFPGAVAVDGAGNVYIADSLNNAIKEYNASTQQVRILVSSGLNNPEGIAVDNSGNVYIADTNHFAIKEWSARAQQVSTLVSTGLTFPEGLAVDNAGNVYFTDFASNTVEEYNVSTHQLSTLVSSGLNWPKDVAVDGAGNVFIADFLDNAVKEWSAGAQQVSTLLYSTLFQAYGVAVDGAGNAYIADASSNAIREYVAATQQLVTLVSSSAIIPEGVAVDSQGDVYIADTLNNAVEEYNPRTQQVTTLVSSGLNAPEGVAVDGAGNVYIADSGNNAIEVYNPSTQQLGTLVSSGLNTPTALAVDRLGDVFIADGNGIDEYNAATQQLGNLVSGLITPSGVAVDGSGNVYFGDLGTNVVEVYSPGAQQVTTLVGGLNTELGLAVDGSGNLYFADGGNSVVDELPRAFEPAGPIQEGAVGGADALAAVLPATQALTGVYAPWSDQSWLTIGNISGGVINFSLSRNTGNARTAHITVLGQQVEVDQAGGAPPAAPTVLSPTATAVTNTTATLGGTVSSDGGAGITRRGILYAPTSVNSNPTLGGTGVTEVDDPGASTGAFTENVVGLSAGSGYSYVAFATNSVGTTYTGPVSTFSTLTLPTVTGRTATAITSTTATLGGDVTGNGGTSITRRGVLYALTSVNSNPTLGGSGVTEVDDASAATGTFTEGITGLTAGSGYTYVAFATNSVGTACTSPATFITDPTAVSVITVALNALGNVTAGTALSAPVATFTAADATASAASFRAVISWGDGQTTSGTITGGGGTFTVRGSTTYAREGRYPLTVTVTDANGDTGTGSGLAHVARVGPPPANLGSVANALSHSPEYYGTVVTAAYRNYLGRTPAPSEVAAWVGVLQGGMSDEQLEAGFIGAPEFIADQGGGGAGWITGLYQKLLGRDPAPSEVNGWLTVLQNGMSETAIAYLFASSPEREAQRIAADYENFLGRPPEAGIVPLWVAAFEGGLKNEGVIANFVGSPEYFQKHGDNVADWLYSVYNDVLGRDPDPAGYQGWLTILQNN